MIEISAFNFTGPIATGAQLRDPTRINIETDNWNPRTREPANAIATGRPT